MTREPSSRALHDDVLKEAILRVWHANRDVYGAYKVLQSTMTITGGGTVRPRTKPSCVDY